jgi:hypothetical protein
MKWNQAGAAFADKLERDTIIMNFMDIVIIRVATSSGTQTKLIGLYIRDEHTTSRNKRTGTVTHNRDNIKSLTLIAVESDIHPLLSEPALTILDITVVKTGSAFKATQRWITSAVHKPHMFALACGANLQQQHSAPPLPQQLNTTTPSLCDEVCDFARNSQHQLSMAQQHCFQILATRDAQYSAVASIHGPPGTGKTTLMVNFVSVLHQYRSCLHRPSIVHVLFVSSTFEAGCNILDRLLRLSTTGLHITLLLAKGRILAAETRFSDRHKVKVVTTGEQLAEVFQPSVADTLIRIVVTTYGMTFAPETPYSDPLLPLLRRFDIVFGDESGQVPSVDVLPTLTLMKKDAWSCFVGDPRQLPPFAGNGQETVNLLRSLSVNIKHCFLSTQRRMVPVLGNVVSRAFYEGALETEVDARELLPFALIVLHNQRNCVCQHCVESRLNSGRGNYHEAKLVSALGAAMQLQGCDNTILTYYAAQKRHVQTICNQKQNIHTIDSVQGREFPHVLISTGRSSGVGFSGDKRRANVGLSRVCIPHTL